MRSLYVCILSCLSLCSFAQSGTIYVPGDYASIQDALNAASSGDTVLVAPGTYVEAVVFPDRSVTLKSMEGPEITVIDENSWPSDRHPVVKFMNLTAPDVVLDGF
ncbi:MAG: hypothetical protein ABIK28_16005, partial [Planctomycetota bacterium]